MMKTVKHVLEKKGHVVHTIGPDASVLEAIKEMDKRGVGALVVLGKEKVMGIITERDYARKVILKGRSSKDTPVRRIMTRKVVYVSPERTVQECMALMTKKRIRHLPVMSRNHLLGIISIGDLVWATIEEKDFIIEQLGKYISGA